MPDNLVNYSCLQFLNRLQEIFHIYQRHHLPYQMCIRDRLSSMGLSKLRTENCPYIRKALTINLTLRCTYPTSK